ncbi:hypothetical protein K456DRAFT_1778180, partial [Colletotrichum gloeosporioides 23]
SDVPYPNSEAEIPKVLAETRWFTRGWTLQELLAPKHLDFYSSDWILLGSRSAFSYLIAEVTGIRHAVISGGSIKSNRLVDSSVAERMSWASRRRTTRLEDIAYCLLGIFGINMPLIYGEGERAFTRLQQAIIHEIDDQSIFAWGYTHVGEPPKIPSHGWTSPLLAGNPSWFRNAGDILPFKTMNIPGLLSSGGNGVTIPTPLLQQITNRGMMYLLAPLRCRRLKDPFNCIAIPLCKPALVDLASEDANSFYRASHAILTAPRNVWAVDNICKPFVYF